MGEGVAAAVEGREEGEWGDGWRERQTGLWVGIAGGRRKRGEGRKAADGLWAGGLGSGLGWGLWDGQFPALNG